MATRSNIGIVNEDKSITGIYVHFDGYPEHNGKILLNHYNNDDIVNGLINLGDLSILGEKLNPTDTHTFAEPQKNVCVAYGRDRGETGTNSRTFEDLGEFENSARNTWADYQYLFDNGVWSYRNVNKTLGWKELTAEVCK